MWCDVDVFKVVEDMRGEITDVEEQQPGKDRHEKAHEQAQYHEAFVAPHQN